jgi:membrane fusion protein, multidrug efflux system
MMTNTRIVQIAGVCALFVVAAGVLWALNHDESASSVQKTDDAYVKADATAVSPRVSGTIAEVAVAENQAVRTGDLLFTLDDRDSRVALDNARAQVANAEANLAILKAQITRQESLRRQARAGIDVDQANLALAEANQKRYVNLAQDGSASVQVKQQADSQRLVQQANRERSMAGLKSVQQQTEVLTAELERAKANLAQATATQAAAELSLSYTRVVAPIDGVVAQSQLRPGAYAVTGKPLLNVVPVAAVYVEANFRETQLARIETGNPVTIRVDALPGVVLHGHVDSVGPASGASFSPIPPHNATGNFTKIVQRLPVRIAIAPDDQSKRLLRVGMSVQPEINTAAHETLPTAAEAGKANDLERDRMVAPAEGRTPTSVAARPS